MTKEVREEIGKYDLECTLRNLRMASAFYGENAIGLLAKDSYETIVSLLDELNHSQRTASGLRKVIKMMKREYKRLGGSKETLARIWATSTTRESVI